MISVVLTRSRYLVQYVVETLLPTDIDVEKGPSEGNC